MSQTQQVQHTDSINSQNPAHDDAKKTKSKRPPNTAFRQQRLKAWQPILTPKTVLPLFFVVGVIFAPIGGLLLWANSLVQELSIDYTKCASSSPSVRVDFDASQPNDLENIPSSRVSATFKTAMTSDPQWGHGFETYTWPLTGVEQNTTVCILSFTIPNEIKPPILFYYRLTNFYQNHRRYVKSVDIQQLKGTARTNSDLNDGDCDPLALAPDGRPYYPCGLIANSMFNDTFGNLTVANPQQNGDQDSAKFYNMTAAGISWSHEGDLYKKSAYKPADVVPPPNWQSQYPDDGYNTVGLPDLHTWEAFQVWMRTAGLPTFSKLAQRNDDTPLTIGTYRLKIYDRFEVEQYSGTKSILISTRTVMGGKNPFLGIAYVVVGGVCILLGAGFLATHLIKPRKLGDHTYLTWNNDQPSTATTTGRNVGGA
ncbi:CDC50 family protein-like protein [Dothidotthia symphoricarpi CBS 119687]|uniref:CDC50 family protein-like protein n=1 Tax=Dothidotthia symphoricarpi CBS 119687 TaxID=1392245 RepID=A0A6A6ADX0_9PLEO|nr:CDC50 family protein-like protein [Dothidotthia symphoricarpi CBS 119687]KAF2129087.1 CDC50 family protein-like protein [Dothidotthia symphoricarpi CBS 119687]